MIRLFVGYDEREALAYHVFCQSVIDTCSVPVSFTPVTDKISRDGSNSFTYSRFLIPWLCDFKGFAIFADSDMLITEDLASLKMPKAACAVVQHENYKAKKIKYVGTNMECPNISYPRKNWSSFIVWNCGHPDNSGLNPEFISGNTGQFLHRFGWCETEALDPRWNRLVGEQDFEDVFNYHFTLGIPAIPYYGKDQGYDLWNEKAYKVNRVPI